MMGSVVPVEEAHDSGDGLTTFASFDAAQPRTPDDEDAIYAEYLLAMLTCLV